MAEITELDKHSQGTTRDKYKTIARASKMKHGELMDHIQSHMLGCDDPDCDICDMGQSGAMIDDNDEDDVEGKSSEIYKVGDRSSTEYRGGEEDIDTEGERAVRESKGDKKNLMKHGEHVAHSAKHPGFKAVQSKIAAKEHLSKKAAGAILAARSRGASGAAKRANPRLARVKG